MLGLVFFFAVVYAALALGLALTTYAAQAWFYENIVERLPLWAAIAAGVLTALLALWALIESKAPGRLDSPFRFSAAQVTDFDQFWSEKQSDTGPTETLFHRRTVPPGRVEYVDAKGSVWRRSDSGVVTAIIIEEDGERKRFNAQLDEGNKFFRDPRDPNKTLDVQYIEDGGKRRVMTESDIGAISTPRYGALILNLLWNCVVLAICVAVFAIALAFDWGRAIVLGVIAWAVIVLLIWPPTQERVAAMAPQAAHRAF